MDTSTEPKRRHRPLNYIQMATNILDGYPYGLSHGFQKDAIQNGWDARRSGSRSFIKDNWEFTIELIKLGLKEVVILTDKGTTGLTGSMISEDISEDTDLPQDQRWARWESMAFQKEGGSSLGARGQGKMIFIAASQEHKIYYDSLRDDGTYRYGWTQATIRDCDVWHLDEEAAKARLKEDFGLSPLEEKGTRVIIPEPVEELKEAIRNGSLLKFIEETWWPIILKYEGKIRVIDQGKDKTATVPSLFPIDAKDSKSFKTWTKENVTVKYQNQNYVIKRICFACDLDNEQEEWIQGVACFRIGMKVESISFTTRSFEKKVFGYTEFDNRTDEELRKLEMPNHYSFKPTGIWRVIKEKIKDEMEAFGNDKLGLGIDRRAAENTKKTGAEIRALDIFKMITKNWTLTYGSIGPIGKMPEQIINGVKEMGILLQEFKFPNDTNTPRVEFGDKIEDFKVVAFNKTSSPKKVILSIYVFDEGGGEPVLNLLNTQFTMNAKSELTQGPFGFTIDEEKFQAGKYTLRCVLLDAESKTREKIDTITRQFWVAMEPKLPSPFDLEGKDLPDEGWEWFLQNQGDSRYTLFYNQMHPVYLENNETEETLGKYIGELCCLAALQLYLREIKKQSQSGAESLPKGPIDPSIIMGNDPEILYKEISKEISTIRKAIREL